MILISHRGNINGRVNQKQNSPSFIVDALKLGYYVEVDVWFKSNSFYLGHDEPKYLIAKQFLQNNKLYCHAKNIQAMSQLIKINAICFGHDNDDYILTSNKKIWVYPGKKLIEGCIAVKPQGLYSKQQLKLCYGICSDFVGDYK